MRKFLPFFFLLVSFVAVSQSRNITGRVTSEADPEGLPGVNVVIKGTNQGTITDLNGNFAINVERGAILVISFVGYKTQEVVIEDQATVDILLEQEFTELDEIVVLGYADVQRRDITGAVATVKADAIKDLSITSIDQGLQGQSSGVQVTQSSGTPGGGIAVRIRGVTSISAGNAPLFIVDGIPVEQGGLSSRNFGGQNDNALALLSASDIESFEVFKDASTKAIYGARASNGVVIIRTKRGKKGQTKVEFDIQRGMVDPVNRLELLNSTQLLELQREAVMNAGQDPAVFGLIPGVTDGVDTDWQDEILRTGIMQQYQVSVSGGDNLTTFYISANYRDEEGVQLNNRFQRFGTTINLERQFTDKFSINTNSTLSRSLNNRVKGDNFLDGVYSGAVKSLPYYAPYDEDGFLIGPASPEYAGFPNFNPVAQALLPRFEATTVKLLHSVNASYKFDSHFRLKGQVSIDFNNVFEDQYESSQTAIGGFLPSVGGQGYGVFIAANYTNVVSFLTMNYNNTFANNHEVSAVLGTEVNRAFTKTSNVQGRLFPSDDFTYIASAGIVDAGSSIRSEAGLQSVFGETRYNYQDTYLATLGFRLDGSSRFGANNRFGFFPALSVAWRISNESFYHVGFMNDLKVRGSIGLSGNERISNFAFLGQWGATVYNGNPGVAPSNVANPNLKWETTREINVGLDASFLEGRIQATMDAYYNKTYDLLLTRPYNPSTGFGGVFDNIGQMENRGIELSVTSNNFVGKPIQWLTTVNVSRNLNKVLELADDEPLYRGYSGEGVDATNIIREGHPLGTFYGLKFLGVDPGTGDAIYEDTNDDGVINNSDAVIIGNSQPDFYGGVTNRLNYKRFDLSVFFQFSVGNKILNFGKTTFVNAGADIVNNQTVDALRRWRKDGDITDVPRYEFENTFNNQHSSRFLEDGSYLRLKNLSFGYNLPTNIANKAMLQGLRLYFSGTNLWTFTRYSGADPEVSTLDGSVSAQGIDFFTLPQVRTLTLGLNATLK